jgi:hypothetical protein
MRPNTEEVLRGVQRSLVTYILPELQSRYAQTQLMIAAGLLGMAADGWDAGAQRLVDDNASWRALAARAADALAGHEDALAGELRAVASESDASLRISDLSSTNVRLREALARAAGVVDAALRSEIIDRLREHTEAHSQSILGPRADG